MKEIEGSRSGAMFVAISDSVLDKGGVVYGVGYTGHFRVSHKRASTRKERDEFRGSKYVQSDLNGIFVQVKDDLKSRASCFVFRYSLSDFGFIFLLITVSDKYG